jgi:hypothetical protein
MAGPVVIYIALLELLCLSKPTDIYHLVYTSISIFLDSYLNEEGQNRHLLVLRRRVRDLYLRYLGNNLSTLARH